MECCDDRDEGTGIEVHIGWGEDVVVKLPDRLNMPIAKDRATSNGAGTPDGGVGTEGTGFDSLTCSAGCGSLTGQTVTGIGADLVAGASTGTSAGPGTGTGTGIRNGRGSGTGTGPDIGPGTGSHTFTGTGVPLGVLLVLLLLVLLVLLVLLWVFAL